MRFIYKSNQTHVKQKYADKITKKIEKQTQEKRKHQLTMHYLMNGYSLNEAKRLAEEEIRGVKSYLTWKKWDKPLSQIKLI